MGRRRKPGVKKKTYRRKQSNDSGVSRKRMLDMGKHDSFKYRLRQVLEDVVGCETILANINSKSTNLGIENAKEYIETIVVEGSIGREKADEIIDLLNRYTRYR